jgi:hypothetical protein
VAIEIAASLGLLRGFNLPDVFGLTKGNTIDVGTLIALLPFGSLADGPKIDHLNHSVALDGNRLRFSSAAQLLGSIAAKCADTLAKKRLREL